ncbi:histidine phosphatase family protein [Saliterribacillus persicus]|uniref:Broad-specificity phosphatase PhoE n=1 Tax=Saliterribacillus persicus TaxID=930114 RepID=A0A368X8D6_9BACI|nr:histidine phosphatase family protein [Saliterribacillus persicus]RCW64233.1 broad-specificity phosphatase PhoE [Saliterribacillus persicus]
MTQICLVRHGETDWNALGKIQGTTDIPLNETGKKQAEACGAFLKGTDWDVLITSPLKRAKETAEIINTYMDMPLEEMAEFKERSFGDAEGMTPEERTERFPGRIYPNQEEVETLHKRLEMGLEKINDRYKNKRVLLVAHGAVINAILSVFSEGEIGSGKTQLMNACLSNISYKENKWEIANYNQVTHLDMTDKKMQNQIF